MDPLPASVDRELKPRTSNVKPRSSVQLDVLRGGTPSGCLFVLIWAVLGPSWAVLGLPWAVFKSWGLPEVF
eukprot:4428509-Pyramimonas_sp.AAC.1